MDKKSIFILVGVLVVVAGVAFLYKGYSSPEKQADNVVQQIEKNRDVSGYNTCMAKVKADRQKIADCINPKLQAQGYTDGIDCIMDFENPICKDTSRYNAQIQASNTCAAELNMEQLSVTELDCTNLLNK